MANKRCTGTNKDGSPCKAMAINDTARCRHHPDESPKSQFDGWSAMEIYNFVLNSTSGRVKLDHHMPIEVLIARAEEALA